MKIFWLFAGLVAFSANATEYHAGRILNIEIGEMPSEKVCIYKSELYSEGAEIQMETQGYYRCERYQQGKTVHKDKAQLRWVRITSQK